MVGDIFWYFRVKTNFLFKIIRLVLKMGNKISIDKHLSSVEDILEVKPNYFKKKIRFDSKIPENITHHVKI
jgi:hypothetical protein